MVLEADRNYPDRAEEERSQVSLKYLSQWPGAVFGDVYAFWDVSHALQYYGIVTFQGVDM
jgi:hypothetical protein